MALSTASDRESLPARVPVQEAISRGLTILGIVAIVSIIVIRYARDGSFWLDEASIALSFRDLELGQVFDRLIGSQSFPRLYFLVIKSARDVFGYETQVLRFFPFVFAIAASVLYLRLFRLRFAMAPALLAVAILLNLIPASWFVYSAFLKQYTLDVFLSLLPFCLPEEFYDRTLGRGEARWKLILLALPCATSLTYLIPLLGRVVGWGLARVCAGERSFDPRALIALVSGIAVSMASLWLTDLRFTLGQEGVIAFHSDYILGHDWGDTLGILLRLAIGWYTGAGEFHAAIGPPLWFLKILAGLLIVGGARVLWDGLRGRQPAPEAPAIWGSRSLGSLAAVTGLLVASPIMQYPVNDSRMTLFLLFHLQILMLEGLSFTAHSLDAKLGRRLGGVPLGAALGLLVVMGLLPAAQRNAVAMARNEPPGNIKPLLPLIAEHPDLTVVVTPCSLKQVETLPGGLGTEDVHPLPFGFDLANDLPLGQEVLVLNAFRARYCRGQIERIKAAATRAEELNRETDTADLWLVELPERIPEHIDPKPRAGGRTTGIPGSQ